MTDIKGIIHLIFLVKKTKKAKSLPLFTNLFSTFAQNR